MVTVNLLTLISMLLTMATGIYVSQSLFSSLWGMREAYLIRPWHVAEGAWGMILVSVHCGLHIRVPERKSPVWIIGYVLIFLPGIWSFVAIGHAQSPDSSLDTKVKKNFQII